MRRLAEVNQGAAALLEFTYEQLLGECGCPNKDEHHYPHRLLHKLVYRVRIAKVAAQNDALLVGGLLDVGGLPYDRPALEFEVEGMVYNLTGLANSETLARTKQLIEQGLAVDCCARRYAEARRQLALLMLVAICDVFHEQARRSIPALPFGRLTGCVECRGSAVGPRAVQCQVCKLSWWCCDLCRQRSIHGRRCPLGGECDPLVSFGHGHLV
jgi:hypothetical protein